MKKLLLLLLVVFMAFALTSCGEKTETAVDEAEKETEVADAGDIQVTQCDGNVCTHVAGSTRECAVEGKCPYREQAAMAKAGVACTHAEECKEAGKCVGKCGGACKGECTFCKERHMCTEACAENCPHAEGHACTADCGENCPHAKGHVCTGDCGENCPHAKTGGAGCMQATEATKAGGCGGCPRAKACKTGS